jgi:hypothetical protein
MAVDTAAKRLAVAHAGRLAPVFPDGTVGTTDRSHLNGVYVFAAVVTPGTPGVFDTYRRRVTGTWRQP